MLSCHIGMGSPISVWLTLSSVTISKPAKSLIRPMIVAMSATP